MKREERKEEKRRGKKGSKASRQVKLHVLSTLAFLVSNDLHILLTKWFHPLNVIIATQTKHVDSAVHIEGLCCYFPKSKWLIQFQILQKILFKVLCVFLLIFYPLRNIMLCLGNQKCDEISQIILDEYNSFCLSRNLPFF